MQTADDKEVVRTGDTSGGMAFSRDDLAGIFAPLSPVEIRQVHPDKEGTFGADFLNAARFTAP